MTNFNELIKVVLNKLGLILSPVVLKLLGCLYKAAEGSMIPAALLRGVPGAGKTSTAEAFALAVGAKKYFYQCNPGTGMDQLIGQPNLAAVLRQDAEHAVSDGILIQAVKAAIAGEDVVLILDEIDKSSPEVDSYLLDFLQSRRIHDPNMNELVIPSDVKFWVFLTSNDERDLSDALMRRVRRVTVDRPSRSTVANVLGIKESCALLDVWDLTEKLAISQLRSYLEDGGDPQNLDLDILGQYVDDLPDLGSMGSAKKVDIPPASVVATVDVGNVSSLAGFKWQPRRNGYCNTVLIEVPTLTEYLRVLHTLPDASCRVLQEETHFLQMDWLTPVVENKDGGVFVLDDDVTIIAVRKEDGRLYLSGDELYHLDTGNSLQQLAEKYQEVIFKEKHSENMAAVRREAAAHQAAGLLAKLGLDDLV